MQGKLPLSTAIVTDAGNRGGGSGLVLSVSIGLCSALVALIAAAVIIISVTVCLRMRKKYKYRTDDGRNNSELRGNDCCSTKHKEDTIYDEGNATYTHLSIAHIGDRAKHDTDDTYDHLPAALPEKRAIHDYACITIRSDDDDIITTQNEAYANSIEISVSMNSAYGFSHQK